MPRAGHDYLEAAQDAASLDIPDVGPVTLPAGFRPSSIPSLDMTRQEMAGRIMSLEFLVKRLYRQLGFDPDDMGSM